MVDELFLILALQKLQQQRDLILAELNFYKEKQKTHTNIFLIELGNKEIVRLNNKLTVVEKKLNKLKRIDN